MSGLSVIDEVGFCAAGLVLATFCMRSMGALRWVAIASNVAFIAYGYLGGLAPVLLLHALLLPVNIWQLAQLRSVHLRSGPTEERRKGGRDSERHYAQAVRMDREFSRLPASGRTSNTLLRSRVGVAPPNRTRCSTSLQLRNGFAPPRSRDPDPPACSARPVKRRFHVGRFKRSD